MEGYEVLVWLPGRGALRQVVVAESVERAVEIARATYAGCLVEVPPPVARKPTLVRSRTCPRAAARTRLKLLKDKQVMAEQAQWAKDAWARVQVDQARTDFLERLYEQDGRASADHPRRSTYTGLYQQYLETLDSGV